MKVNAKTRRQSHLTEYLEQDKVPSVLVSDTSKGTNSRLPVIGHKLSDKVSPFAENLGYLVEFTNSEQEHEFYECNWGNDLVSIERDGQTSLCPSPDIWRWIAGLLNRYQARVVKRLYEAEGKEPLLYEKDVYALARRIVNLVGENRDIEDPYFIAFCWQFGGTPENLARKIQEYRDWMLRNTLPQKRHCAPAAHFSELPPKKQPKRVEVSDIQKKKGVRQCTES